MPRPGELLDHVVGALAGLGALDVARFRDDDGHGVAEISIGVPPDKSIRLLVAANVTAEGRADPAGVRIDHDGSMAAILAERERLARDLHDDVVQEVFATAMALAALVPQLPDGVRRRIEDLIDRQDEIVRRLRTTVFALKGCSAEGRSAQQAVARVVAEAQRSLGFEPSLRVVGDLSELDGSELVDHLVMALRESLSNVARHARATAVDAEVAVSADEVRFALVDDGSGLGNGAPSGAGVGAPHEDRSRGDGLRNLEQRARLLGGTCRVANGSPRGTVVTWSVPRHHEEIATIEAGSQTPVAASSERTSASPT